MNCQEIETLMDAYFDGETDLVRSLEVEKHTDRCASCAGRLKSLQTLRTSLKSAAPYYAAPVALRAWARAQGRRPSGDAPRSLWSWQAWTPAGAFALVFAALYLGSPILSVKTAERRLEDDVVSAHVRSLMATHLTDVTSTNQHTVKPWFNGKVDFSPAVKDFTSYDFPLVGGRLDYLAERPVAALVYKRRQHLINLFEWPSPRQADRAVAAVSRRGYNLLHWTKSGMAYWAISDVNPKDLEQFVQIIQTQELLPTTTDIK